MSKRIIGIGGRLRSGKDTVADHLVAKHGFTKLGMSDPLLKAALVLDPIIEADVSRDGDIYGYDRLSDIVNEVGYVKAKEYAEVRRFLQVLGTDFGRNMIGENVWVNIAAQSIMDTPGDVVITGLRFPNETQMIGDIRGETWWVERQLHTEAPLADHASENGVDWEMFDSILQNESTLSWLFEQADHLIDHPPVGIPN